MQSLQMHRNGVYCNHNKETDRRKPERKIEMTYKYYMMKNKLNDSKETFTEYCEKYHSTWNSMNPGMQKQFVEVNYKFRFAIHW